MARFIINGTTGAPLGQTGTAGDDLFVTTGTAGLLVPGQAQEGGAGLDHLVIRNAALVPITDAAFAGLTGFEVLRLQAPSFVTDFNVTLGGLAAAAFGNAIDLRLAGAQALVDASALTSATTFHLVGSIASDTLTGGAGADTMRGGFGNDGLTGGAGDDDLRGDDGRDTLNGGEGQDKLQGGAGIDLLRGGGGDDRLFGGVGADTLDGGAGNDRLQGDAGADTFILSDGIDRVMDFVDGEDLLDVSAFGITGIEALLAVASEVANGLRLEVAPGSRTLLIGATLAELDASDFVFAAEIPVTIVEDRSFVAEPGNSIIRTLYTDEDDVAGTSLADVVTRSGSVTGGAGAAGGEGVSGGADGLETYIFGSPLDTRSVADGEDGAGGNGGEAGGNATVRASGYDVALGNPGSPLRDAASLEITALAGGGGSGGAGEAGGDSAFESDLTVVEDGSGLVVDGVADTTGSGGAGGGGGSGGPGGAALAELVDYGSSATAAMDVTLVLEATGGAGASGGAGGAGGIGAFDADLTDGRDGGEGGAGGAGGRGGDATARAKDILGLASTDMGWTIVARATGGAGGVGGAGGTPGTNQTSVTEEVTGGAEPFFVTNIDTGRDIGGNGRKGGNGGDARAEISDVNLDPAGDDPSVNLIRLEAAATGGAGGAGGLASTEIGIDEAAEGGGITTTSHAGVAGLDGVAGARGSATIAFLNNTVVLSGGEDTLQLAAYFDGGVHVLAFSGNTFIGGSGDDALDLTGFHGFGARVDVAAGTLSFDGGPANAMFEFEDFYGTENADTFIDGAGAQVYFGGSGADVFIFAPGHSQDSLQDFTQGQDLMDLSAFGYAGFEDLDIAYGGGGTGSSPAFAVVTTSGGSGISITFNVVTGGTLTAADFVL